VGVVRAGHSLGKGRITAARYAAGAHISVSRVGSGREPVDEALHARGLARKVVVVLPGGFATALGLARSSELIATVPEHHTGQLRTGMHTFALPIEVAEFTVSLLWHPRLDADPAHRWLRGCIREVCTRPREPASNKASGSGARLETVERAPRQKARNSR
jgi:DNA-binding transcriptional LysR family regulator